MSISQINLIAGGIVVIHPLTVRTAAHRDRATT
jgi:hypothetical protein